MSGLDLFPTSGSSCAGDGADISRDSFEMRFMEFKKKRNPVTDECGEENHLNFEKLLQLLESNEEKTKDVKQDSDIVVAIGSSGAGLSTFVQLIAGHKMKAEWDERDNRRFTFQESNGEKGFEVTHGLESMTENTRSYYSPKSSTYYIDTPGFNNTRYLEIDIATLISIQRMCAKANRIRFVVLVNTYSLYDRKGSSLKSCLDHARYLIGENFKPHKKAFSFLFTKCTSAFSEIAQEDLMSLNSEQKFVVLEKAKEKLTEKLTEIGECAEPDLKYLVGWMCYSIEKGTSYCDILDPVITDVLRMKERLEPAFRNQHFLKGSDNVVQAYLSPESWTLLGKELERRKNNLKYKLTGDDLDDIFSKETKRQVHEGSLLLCKIARYIDFPICRETVIEALEFLKKISTEKNTEISEGLSDKLDVTGNSARIRRCNIENVKFLDAVLRECITYLTASVETEAFSPNIHQLLDV